MISWTLVTLSTVAILCGVPTVQGNDFLKLASALNATRGAQDLHKLVLNLAHEAKISKLGLKARASSLNLNEPCKSHYDFYQQAYTTGAMWAMTMYDSNTKFPPSSILEGATVHLGNFDECISVRDVVWNNETAFHGQHCMVSYSFKNKKTRAGPAVGMLTSISLKMAQCVPSTCSAADAAEIGKDIFSSMQIYLDAMGIEVITQANELECQTADAKEFTSKDMLATTILAFFAGLVFFSTCYDIYKKDDGSRSKVATAFSVYTNGKKLLAITSANEDTLHCVHGIRFITMAWIIFGHRYLNSISVPTINIRSYLEDMVPDWRKIGVTNGMMSVDTFFLLSGLMLSYVFLRQVHKTNKFNLPMFYINRYLRLTPAYAIMLLLEGTLLAHSGSGPLWDVAAAKQVETCEKYWWYNLLYVQIYKDSMNQCVRQGWYLAVDMQLYWLSPIVLIPMWKWPKIGLALAGLLTAGGVAIIAVLYYNGEYSISYISMLTAPNLVDYMDSLYYPAYSRYVPYVVGIILGYVLVDIKLKKREVRLSKLVSLILWLVAGALLLVSLCISNVFQQPDYVYSVADAVSCASLSKLAWSVGLALVIFLCATGHGGIPNAILSWEWFQPLSRLTYSAFLVHIALQASQLNSLRTPVFLDDMTLIPQAFGDLFMALLLAVVLTLVFEAPFIILGKELLGGAKPKSQPRLVTGNSNEGYLKDDEVRDLIPVAEPSTSKMEDVEANEIEKKD